MVFLVNAEASLSEIARKTKTTKANTFHSLKRLENLDLVRKTVRGKTHIYRFNFLHPMAEQIIGLMMEERRVGYAKKLNNIPPILHSFLLASLKAKYKGCIFFGSSIENKYNDIDVFVVLEKAGNEGEIGKKIKLIDSRLSPIFGTERELDAGAKNMDMLYNNIIDGISFGLDIARIKHKDLFLRKNDIRERFIIGYREILSCLEFHEMEYRKKHLEAGVMDFIYSILNYFDMFPKNDREALGLFNKQLKEQKPKTIKSAIVIMEKYAWIL